MPGASADTESSTTFGPGTYIVGTDIAPGTYVSDNTSGHICLWERPSGFSGESDDVIASDIAEDGQIIVEIAPTDAGFSADEQCGTWTLVS